MTVSGERRLERSSSTSSSRHHRQPHSRYGYSELTPILIFDKVAKSTVSQVTENGWDVTTYQYQSGGFSQVKSKRMEINFGISGLLKPGGQQGKDKDRSKSSKKKNTNTLPRRWSFKLPKLVERKEAEPGPDLRRGGKETEVGGSDIKAVRVPPPPPRRHPPPVRSESDSKHRPWVTKILLNEKEEFQSGRRAKSPVRNNSEEKGEREEENKSAFLSNLGSDDLINVEIKEMYSSPMLDLTMPGFYTHTQDQPFQDHELYENSENSGSNGTVESFVDDSPNETCSFEDIDNIMDTITENVNEMDLYDDTIVSKDDEMDEDYSKDDISSKTSSEDFVIIFNDQPKLKGRGSILKHPGQKRRNIKHVEFLDMISDSNGNSDSVRYF